MTTLQLAKAVLECQPGDTDTLDLARRLARAVLDEHERTTLLGDSDPAVKRRVGLLHAARAWLMRDTFVVNMEPHTITTILSDALQCSFDEATHVVNMLCADIRSWERAAQERGVQLVSSNRR